MAETNPQPVDPAAVPPASGAPDASAERLASQALDAAQTAVDQLSGDSATDDARPVSLPSFDDVDVDALPQGIDLLSDVNLHVKIELGRTRMLVEDVLRLNSGSVVELDKLAGDPVDIYVNDRPVARGEVLVLNDTFCVRINEILNRSVVAGASEAKPE